MPQPPRRRAAAARHRLERQPHQHGGQLGWPDPDTGAHQCLAQGRSIQLQRQLEAPGIGGVLGLGLGLEPAIRKPLDVAIRLFLQPLPDETVPYGRIAGQPGDHAGHARLDGR